MATINIKSAKINRDVDGVWLAIKTDDLQTTQKAVYDVLNSGKEFVAEIKRKQNRRSLDANAYAWSLIDQIAKVIGTNKWDVYLTMLSRYGVFTHLIVKPDAVERIKQEWRTCSELGEVTVNGKTGIQLQCYYGSSTYDTREMAHLINGIVSECQDLGIETMTPQELSLMCSGWSK